MPWSAPHSAEHQDWLGQERSRVRMVDKCSADGAVELPAQFRFTVWLAKSCVRRPRVTHIIREKGKGHAAPQEVR